MGALYACAANFQIIYLNRLKHNRTSQDIQVCMMCRQTLRQFLPFHSFEQLHFYISEQIFSSWSTGNTYTMREDLHLMCAF